MGKSDPIAIGLDARGIFFCRDWNRLSGNVTYHFMSLMPTKLKSPIPLHPDKKWAAERVSFEGKARIAAEIDTHVRTTCHPRNSAPI